MAAEMENSTGPRVGFIGTGVMGAGMVRRLLAAGYPVAVYNRTRAKAQPLEKDGAEIAGSVAALAAGAEIVVTMVGFPADVEALYFGGDGILAHARAGAYLIDMTTSSPSLARRIHEAAVARGLHALDAPVSGGDIGARDGTLSIMAGGDAADFEALRPVFAAMGRNIRLQGPAGAGQHAKMCNQIAIAGAVMGVCESLAYMKKAGLDPENALQSISAGAAGSWQLSAYAPRILKGDFAPGFYIRHFIKDMGIALAEAEKMGLDLPALRLAKSLYDRLQREGRDGLGTQALYLLYAGGERE
jgi:3-hydroxyisobutyrate dehydrogenase